MVWATVKKNGVDVFAWCVSSVCGEIHSLMFTKLLSYSGLGQVCQLSTLPTLILVTLLHPVQHFISIISPLSWQTTICLCFRICVVSRAVKEASRLGLGECNITVLVTNFNGQLEEYQRMIMVLNTIIFIIQSLMVSWNELDPRVSYFGSYFLFFFHSAQPTDKAGVFASQYTEPEPWASPDATTDNPWNPFEGRLWFNFAHHHFVCLQSSEKNTDISLDLLKAGEQRYQISLAVYKANV